MKKEKLTLKHEHNIKIYAAAPQMTISRVTHIRTHTYTYTYTQLSGKSGLSSLVQDVEMVKQM